MLISEELFLLLTKDDGSAETWSLQGWALAGAVIADLAALGRLEFSDHKDPRVTVIDASPTGNPILDDALARLVDKQGKKLSSLVQDGKLNPEKGVVAALAAAGVIGVQEKRLLGLVPEKRPTLNPRPEAELRERLRLVLAGSTPTIGDATLLALLQGLDSTQKVLKAEAGGMNKRDLKARIEQVTKEIPEGGAVSKAIEQFNSVMLTAVIVPTIITTTST